MEIILVDWCSALIHFCLSNVNDSLLLKQHVYVTKIEQKVISCLHDSPNNM